VIWIFERKFFGLVLLSTVFRFFRHNFMMPRVFLRAQSKKIVALLERGIEGVGSILCYGICRVASSQRWQGIVQQ
jgi:hypothetical protein